MLSKTPELSPRVAWLVGAVLTIIWLIIYTITASPTVNFIDSGELITALHEPGIVHPPGYPLYTLLGYVASLLPLGEVARRINLFSAFWGAAAVGIIYVLLITAGTYTRWLLARRTAPEPAKRKSSRSVAQPVTQIAIEQPGYDLTTLLAAVGAASLLGTASTFWNRSVQAKMYTLHYFFVLLLFWLALQYRWAYERGDKQASQLWLVALAVTLGLSFTNHLMTSLLVPGIALLLLAGSDWRARLRNVTQRWWVALPAFLLPLLLYLYLPIRASQAPIMYWGSPDNWPDLWRHVSGWQYTAYLQNDIAWSLERLTGYASGQWVWLTWLVFGSCLLSGVLLARANVWFFVSTLVTGVVTIFFSLQYGISEIEPYLVPLYEMLIIWLGTAPAALERWNVGMFKRYALPASALLVVLALVTAVLQFPRQNRSNDHLAELFALNLLNSLEKDAIIITDHWDFQSPAYYLQLVRNERPDVVVIDKSLLRYPWYLAQLERRYPWLVANSQDIIKTFTTEQKKWVNGEPFDQALLNQSYFDLLTSFVERNIDERPAYAFFSTLCGPVEGRQGDEAYQIATNYTWELTGLAYRYLPQPPPAGARPFEPKYDLRGYTYDKAPLDEFAKFNAGCYATAYSRAAQRFADSNDPAKAQELAAKAAEMQEITNGEN